MQSVWQNMWRANVAFTLLFGLSAVAQGIKYDFRSADKISSAIEVSGDENWNAQFSVNGLDNTVEAIAVSSTGEVYVGGSFINAGTTPVNRIAKWNGSSWSALGSGLNNSVFALAVSGTDLYVAGRFTTAGGISANRIAKWNGSSWSAMGSGVSSSIYALAVRGSEVYVGGDFTTAGGVSALHIAKWDGSAWSALGSGISGGVMFKTVNAIGISGTDVFAGGDFTTAGGVSAKSVARWNGSSWSALGSGVDNWGIQAITVSGSDIVVGGWFLTAGGVSAHLIAKWNGTSWSALGIGVDNVLMALASGDGNIYAAGNFVSAGSVSAKYVAKWDGASWSALGSGLNGQANAIAVNGDNVYVGGLFTTAGGKPSNHFAHYNARVVFTGLEESGGENPTSFDLYQNYPNPFNASTNIQFSIPWNLHVTLKVLDCLGREVTTLVSEALPAGSYVRRWDAMGMASGVYICRLQGGEFVETKKLVVLK